MEPTLIDTEKMIRAEDSNTPDEAAMLRARLEELTKETNQFTYIITHDLQAPLRMVTGFLELLEKKHADKLDDSARQYIEYAVKGSLKMKNLIFDLLEYSRLSSVTYEFGPTDLNEVCREAEEKLADLIGGAGAVISIDPLPAVHGSKKLLLQLLGHILDNAIKFRGEEKPAIHIYAEKMCEHWKIHVCDNGIGVDPLFFERIFVVFKRLHTDEIKYKGTGIGLAICKKIIELHGGVIGIDSSPGQGSDLWFTIPVSKIHS